MHSCTAAQLQPKVIIVGLLCFPFCLCSCIVSLGFGKNPDELCEGGGLIRPNLSCQITYFFSIFFVYFSPLEEGPNYTSRTVEVWHRKLKIAVLQKSYNLCPIYCVTTLLTRVGRCWNGARYPPLWHNTNKLWGFHFYHNTIYTLVYNIFEYTWQSCSGQISPSPRYIFLSLLVKLVLTPWYYNVLMLNWTGLKGFFLNLLYKKFTTVITLCHLSKHLLFGSLSFPLVLGAKKIVFLLCQKIILILTRGGQYDLTKNYSKMHLCTAGHIFWSNRFFLSPQSIII